jgi:RNA 3'-terminal phosphate cyclase (ATP)
MAQNESTIRFIGGTHNMWAPSYDFIKHSFLTTLRLMNIHVETDLQTHGFFPVGGGQWSALIRPLSKTNPLELIKRGDMQISAVVTQAQLSGDIAERELNQVQKSLGLDDAARHLKEVTALCPGNVLSIRLKHGDGSAEVIDSIGQKGISSERVANQAVKEAQRYLNSKAVVGEYLGDQLLLPMALGNGGRFTTLKPSLHTLTNIDVIQQFLDCNITVTELDNDCFEIRVAH